MGAMKIACVCCAALLIARNAFCQEPNGTTIGGQQPTITVPAEVRRVLDDYEKAWRMRDAGALANLFTEDGFVLSPGSPMVRGHREIRKHYHGAGGPLSLRAVAFSSDGIVGYIIGAFSDRPGVPDRGKFTLTLRRHSSGKWMISSDMDNGNIPQPDCHPVSR